MSEPTIHISNLQLALAVALVLLPAACSLLLHLGLGKKIVIAALRTTLQLLAVGYVLEWVFDLETWWAVSLIVVFMLVMAGWTAVGRAETRYRGIYLDTFVSMTLSALAIVAVGTIVVIRNDPWWAPRYLIPVLGMLLGNSMTGISLGLSVWLDNLRERSRRIESLLALGATRWEASRELVRQAARQGLIPILNSMAAAGVVSLPGMMTGQILAGNTPALAVRYQIVIMFLIAATVAGGSLGVVMIAYRRLFDRAHRLRLDRLKGH